MTRYIIRKTSNRIIIEKRTTKGMVAICNTSLPAYAENVMAEETTRMIRLGLSFQVENRTNIHMDV